MIQYKQKSLIPNIATDKAINTDKKWIIIADKKLNTGVDKAINTDKK